jgi:hypothetical protein
MPIPAASIAAVPLMLTATAAAPRRMQRRSMAGGGHFEIRTASIPRSTP